MEIGKGVQVDNNFPWNQGNFHTTMFSAKIDIFLSGKKVKFVIDESRLKEKFVEADKTRIIDLVNCHY